MSNIIKIAQLQTPVFADITKTMETVSALIEKVSHEKVDLIALPEMFSCPYETSKFPIYAEKEQGEIWQACSTMAKQYNVYLSAGSIPEIDDAGNVFNTAYVFDRNGKQIAKHRKVHLFDIDISGGQKFKESDTLTAGNQVTVFDTEFCKIGICICYDFRFPELARLMVDKGAKIILVPGAFNMTTGPAHWELVFRSRALDNQVYTLGTAPARNSSAEYVSWGHSIAVTPWGNVISEMNEDVGYRINELDLNLVDQIREQLPLLRHKRNDLLCK